MNYTKTFFASIIVASVLFLSSNWDPISAQSWSQCPDGSQITRCETYDCPQGDTNQDGLCSPKDRGARLSDARNDAFCANPASGCGEVRYFKKDTSLACAIRVKETETNCDLYSTSKANFSTATPQASASPRATFQPLATSTTQALGGGSNTTKGGQEATDSGELPETGPEIFITLSLIASAFFGFYLYERAKLAQSKNA